MSPRICSLRTASLTIAVVDMICAIFIGFYVLTLAGFMIGATAGIMDDLDAEISKAKAGAALGLMVSLFIIMGLVCIAKFYLGLVLKRGVEQNDANKCKLWFIMNGFILFLGIISTGCDISSAEPATDIMLDLGYILYLVLCMAVVSAFTKSLREENQQFKFVNFDDLVEKEKPVKGLPKV